MLNSSAAARRCSAWSTRHGVHNTRLAREGCALPRNRLHDAQCRQMYSEALDLARSEQFDAARLAFRSLLATYPELCKVWVSYAQMEKRCSDSESNERLQRCRDVLHTGMIHNPDSACIAQAWGLLELQRGNMLAAIMLLERSVKLDKKLAPVLRWKPVAAARDAIGRTIRTNTLPAASSNQSA